MISHTKTHCALLYHEEDTCTCVLRESDKRLKVGESGESIAEK